MGIRTRDKSLTMRSSSLVSVLWTWALPGLLITTTAADVLATFTPCPECPQSIMPAPITITAQYQRNHTEPDCSCGESCKPNRHLRRQWWRWTGPIHDVDNLQHASLNNHQLPCSGHHLPSSIYHLYNTDNQRGHNGLPCPHCVVDLRWSVANYQSKHHSICSCGCWQFRIHRVSCFDRGIHNL